MKNFKKVLSLTAAVALAASALLPVTAFADDTFKIGMIGPLTGGAAIYGSAVANAAKIAVDEVNEAGGIAGFTVEYNPQDDEHDAEKSVNAYNTLKDWGMQLLLGTVTSAPCIAVEAEAASDNMFLLTPSGTAVDCITAGDNAFRVCFSDPAQGTEAARYIGEHGLAETVGVLYDSSDVYSSGIYATFRAEAEGQPFEIVAETSFTADSKTDFSAQLQTLKDSGCQLVFIPFYYNEATIVLKQAHDMGFEAAWFGVDGMDGILSVEGFDTSLAENLMLLTPFSATAEDELTQNFVAKYVELYGDIPNQFAADAYDGIYIMKQAAEQAGVTPDMDPSEICDAMKTAMTEITFTGITGEITWTAEGEPTKDPIAVIIKDGVYEFM
ncbi:MAG: ABC transporter substrate-binding protein [Blautia sp.]|nr:ABC transporter substrate-binding protein [Blautia sp.]